jgi:hypothetical protein
MVQADAREPDVRSRPGGRALVTAAARALFAAALLAAPADSGGVSAAGTGAARPAAQLTRADLAALRRRVALLESELALARSRKPYLVVDAESKRLRQVLFGVTLREIPARDIDIDGLRRVGEDGVPGPLSLAGIVTLKEKDKDPRLSPLTPEQIEQGAADENVADALPPEAPADYGLTFQQPVVVRIEGIPEKKTGMPGILSWWPRWWSRGGTGREEILLSLTVHLDETTAREVYRSLLPGERLIVVPPPGLLLPDAGQETPRSVRQGRPAKPPAPSPGLSPAGVPFRIPPPVAETPADGASPASAADGQAGTAAPVGDVAPAPSADAPAAPTPPPDDQPAETPPP